MGLDAFFKLKIQIESRKGLGWSSEAGTSTFKGQSDEASKGGMESGEHGVLESQRRYINSC